MKRSHNLKNTSGYLIDAFFKEYFLIWKNKISIDYEDRKKETHLVDLESSKGSNQRFSISRVHFTDYENAGIRKIHSISQKGSMFNDEPFRNTFKFALFSLVPFAIGSHLAPKEKNNPWDYNWQDNDNWNAWNERKESSQQWFEEGMAILALTGAYAAYSIGLRAIKTNLGGFKYILTDWDYRYDTGKPIALRYPSLLDGYQQQYDYVFTFTDDEFEKISGYSIESVER